MCMSMGWHGSAGLGEARPAEPGRIQQTLPAEPGDYCILLTCGGPALRITGELRGWPAVAVEPCGFQLEYQDWGTPWTCYTDADADALDWFTGLFYYGE